MIPVPFPIPVLLIIYCESLITTVFRNKFVESFKYLGHIISNSNIDDADIQREVSNMFIRTNILARKFSKCSTAVKTVLFTV